MEQNSITKVPLGIFSQASELTTLNLRENQLSQLPLGTTSFLSLLSPPIPPPPSPSLPLQSLPPSFADFGTWVTLTELDLGTNQLSALPEEVQELTRLEVLILANNAIRVRFHGNIGQYRRSPLTCVFVCADFAQGHLSAEELACSGP